MGAAFWLRLRLEGESEENMKKFPMLFALAILLVGSPVLARHVTHRVTPSNIDKQSFAFTVQAKDVGQLKEFQITVRQKAHPGPGDAATGSVVIRPSGDQQAAFPLVTRVRSDGMQTYTFRLSPSDLNRASFTFTETPQDWKRPFASPGDYWVFNLSDFAANPKE